MNRCCHQVTRWGVSHRYCHNAVRTNPVGIQLLSEALHKQIFGDASSETNPISPELLAKVKDHLRRHDLINNNTERRTLPNVEFQLPPMQGKNLADHFLNIAIKQASPYIKLADQMFEYNIPPIPEVWKCEPGWHRYSRDGSVESVPYPDETAYVFDVETLVDGNYPVMATAVSADYWYAWCSQRLSKDAFIYSLRPPKHAELIPMESELDSKPEDLDAIPRLVLGHNVGYDRSYMREQYFIKEPKMKFMDTMSMHIAICGFTSMQRILYMAKRKGKNTSRAIKERPYANRQTDFDWMETGCLNNLNDVYRFHCDGINLDKQARNVFVKGTLQDIRDDFQNLMKYCANDVRVTHEIYKKLWPQFRNHFPSPVTIAGMLELGTAYLPINSNWNRYLELSDQSFAANEDEVHSSLAAIAANVCSKYADSYKSDPWLFDLDWSTPGMRLLKTKRKQPKDADQSASDNLHPVVKNLLDSARKLPLKEAHMPGVPKWYSEHFPPHKDKSWGHGPSGLTLLRRVTPKILKLKWDGYPLYYHIKHGWGYIVPDREDWTEIEMFQFHSSQPLYPYREARDLTYSQPPSDQSIDGSPTFDGDFSSILEGSIEKDSLTYAQSQNIWNQIRVMSEHQKQLFFQKISKEDGSKVPSWHTGIGPVKGVKIPCGWFYKLPHKNGDNSNVGNPLTRDFLPQIGNGTLTSAAGSDAIRALTLKIQGSYWQNNRDRIKSQMVMWLQHNHLPESVRQDDSYNPDGLYGAILPRISTAGTITRRAVEKTWLTASNANENRIGSELKSMIQSPPGYHFVGADVDSQELWIASLLGDAYFAGIHGCTAIGWMTLQGTKAEGTDVHSKTASLIGMSRDDAKVFNYGRIYGAGRMFARKLLMQFNRKMSKEEASTKANNMYKATKGTKAWKNSRQAQTEDLPYQRACWSGGSESDMFNALEHTAVSADPRTPVLRCKITKPLHPQYAHDEFMTSRINWVVQSSAVDYLHLMLVCMRWLFDEFDIDGRFCISIHDEVRYLVKSEDRYRAALALHITNLYTRAFFAHKLGFNDLPQSVAFFSGVDLDKCLRKETAMDCRTPSNMHGMQGSYHIPPGETLDIYETLKYTSGSLHKSIETHRHTDT